MRNATSGRSSFPRSRQTQHPPDHVAVGTGAARNWGAFIAELERAYRPYGRASHEVRIAARRVARHMARAKVTPDDIRRELARAVRSQASQSAFDDDRPASDGRGYETFLADVLRTAVEPAPSAPRLRLTRDHTGGDDCRNL